MQIYPIYPSFSSGQFFELAVQPRRRFSIAIYQQQNNESLTSVSGVIVSATNNVKAELVDGKYVFLSVDAETRVRFDKDWEWPTITIKPNTPELRSGAYVAVAYEVGPRGEPLTDLGRRCSAHQAVFGWPPDSDSMALIVARPRTPEASLAYVIPTATYHAYNSTGGGCFTAIRFIARTPRRRSAFAVPAEGLAHNSANRVIPTIRSLRDSSSLIGTRSSFAGCAPRIWPATFTPISICIGARFWIRRSTAAS